MTEDTRSGEVPPTVSGADIRTFLFADMRGYTRFTQEHGDEAASAVASLFADLVREAVPEFEGELLELRGDEALCVFRSARQALRASVELQRRLRTATDEQDAFPLGVGMGLDAGEAVPTQGGYRGASLNLAARLCAIAKPGEVLATESAAHLARLVDGLRLVARRPVRLKGMAEPVRLVEVLPEVPLPLLPDPRSGSASRRRRTSRRAVWAIVAGLVVVGGAVAGLVAREGSGRPLTVYHDALVFITPGGDARTVGPLGAAPSAVAVGGGRIWVANRDAGTVTALRLDGGPSDTIRVGTAPTGVVYDHGTVWVADSGSGTVDRINGFATPISIPTGNGPQGVAVSRGRVWVSNSLDETVSEIDPGTDKVVRQIPAGPDPTAIVAAHGTIWVANTTSDTVSRINASTGQPLPPVPVENGPDALAVSGNGVWVANGDSGTATHINATNAQPGVTIPAGLAPTAIAVTGGMVWVSDSRGKLVGLHPSAPNRRTRAALTGVPLALARASSGLWATVEPPLTGHRGGTLRVVAQSSPPDPVDPAINYTNPGWQVLFLTNDGLTGFQHVSGPQGETIAPDLATSIPQPTDFGRTYTFAVRRGVRYSNGLPVRPADFRCALERTFDAGVGVGIYDHIVGAAACEHRAPPIRCDLRHGVVTDNTAGTVTFHLTRPDPDFLAKLALPFADAVLLLDQLWVK